MESKENQVPKVIWEGFSFALDTLLEQHQQRLETLRTKDVRLTKPRKLIDLYTSVKAPANLSLHESWLRKLESLYECPARVLLEEFQKLQQDKKVVSRFQSFSSFILSTCFSRDKHLHPGLTI
jgi:hypothetical protein